jgi:carboxypeptidase family protein
MLRPGKVCVAFALIVAGISLQLLSGTAHAGECVIVPIKPIRCVCGVVIDPSGGRISNAKVTLLKGETELVSKRTGTDGKFSFEPMQAGKYQIQVEATGFRTAKSSFVIVKPARKCKQALQVKLGFGFECDTGIALIREKTIR